MTTECVYGSGLSQNFAAMQYATRDEVLLSSAQWNPFPINDQGIAALDHDHVFVVIVDVRSGSRGLAAGPKRHLAPIRSIEYVPFDSWGGLIGLRNPVCWMFHEFGKIVHSCELVSHLQRQTDHSAGHRHHFSWTPHEGASGESALLRPHAAQDCKTWQVEDGIMLLMA